MNKATPKLKPCPFCGKDTGKITSSDKLRSSTHYTVICTYCGYKLNTYFTERSAATIWNRRPLEDALAEELKSIRAEHSWRNSEDRMGK